MLIRTSIDAFNKKNHNNMSASMRTLTKVPGFTISTAKTGRSKVEL